jgi:hypothetical protein
VATSVTDDASASDAAAVLTAPDLDAAATCGGYCRDRSEHFSNRHGYGPRLAATVQGTWERGRLALKDVLSGEPSGDALLTLDLAEDLYDSEHSSGAGPGQYYVDSDAFGRMSVVLSPARNAAERDAGVLALLPRQMEPPLRIAATATRDGALLLVLVHAIARLDFPPPEELPSPDVLAGPDAGAWDRHYVVTTGPWRSMFEISSFGTKGVWLGSLVRGAEHCFPSVPVTARGPEWDLPAVRVTGIAYTANRRYGHGGVYKAQIEATRIVRLDPSRPECR